MAWQTPIYRVNIHHYFEDPKMLNEGLSDIILQHYTKLVSGNKAHLMGLDAAETNNVFFEWQTSRGGWNLIAAEQEWSILSGFINATVDMYLALLGKSPEFVQMRSKATEQWATVHRDGMDHGAHTHPGCVVSGVYYIKMPPHGGRIVFDDPRGNGRAPFDSILPFNPREGDLILFPSWLLHKVTPTRGAEPRISIAFNVPGKWEDVTDSKDVRDLGTRNDMGAMPEMPIEHMASADADGSNRNDMGIKEDM